MNISLSKNEQFALFAVVFIAIAVAGVFLFIKPGLDKVDQSKAVRAQQSAKLAEFRENFGLEKFQALEEEILELWQEGVDAGEDFYKNINPSYDTGRLVRHILGEIEMEIDNLVINDYGLNKMGLSKFDHTDLNYGMKSAAEDNIVEPPPEVTSIEEYEEELTVLQSYMSVVSRKEGINFFEDWFEKYSDENNAIELVNAMREYLVRDSEVVASQKVTFDITLNPEQAKELSMHIYKLHETESPHERFEYKTTYLSGMKPKGQNTVSDQDDLSDEQIWEVEMMFYVAHPAKQPTFNYKDRWSWT
ncbi:MAG: hypothetical protein FWF82_01205 [Oscillospiraceae bacterium]|nr:hypothetical protein [Oscillospiraceae bacterium]